MYQHVLPASKPNTHRNDLWAFFAPTPQTFFCMGRHILGFHRSITCIQRTNIIIVVIDKFSKAAHFGSLTTNFIACKAVELFSPTWFVCIMVILEA